MEPPLPQLDEGIALTLIGEAVFARCLSAIKENASLL
jgi:6-phosphogluconate dehydrogenase